MPDVIPAVYAADAAEAAADSGTLDDVKANSNAGDAGASTDAWMLESGDAGDASDSGAAAEAGRDGSDFGDGGGDGGGDAGDASIPKNVFIFAGQSNIAGSDAVIDPTTFVRTASDQQTLFTFTGLPAAYNASSDYVPWGEVAGYHCCIAYNNPEPIVIGSDVGFERRLTEVGMTDIAIVQAWGRFTAVAPVWPWGQGGDLNIQWMTFVDHQLAELRARGIDPQIRGFVWDQGIDDALLTVDWASQYGARLTALIAFVRARFGIPDAPFVLARQTNSSYATGLTGAGPNDPMALVRAANVQVGSTVTRAAWIDVDDLPNVNIHHFSAGSHLVIGQRFADAYLRIVAAPPPSN